MPAYRRIPLSDLFIDPNYQREFKPRHAEKIDRDFDDALLQTIEVSWRDGGEGTPLGPNGEHGAVFDGQHRLPAMRNRDMEAPCLVHTGLTPGQEADLFRRLQDGRVQLQPLERFKARLHADPPDPVAHGIDDTCQQFAIKIGAAANNGELAAIVVAERVYKRGNLRPTLSLITRLWFNDKRALDGSMLDGLSRFLLLYEREFDEEHAISKWEEVSPVALIRKADSYLKTAHSSKAYGVLEALREEYTNKAHRLPSVEKAEQELRKVQRDNAARYRRVPVSEVRDAAMELRRFTPETMRDHLSISLSAARDHILELTKLGQFRRLRVRKEDDFGGTALDGLKSGQHYYEYVPIHERKRPGENPRSRPRHGDGTGARRNGSEAVPYTGKPIKRTGNLTRQQKGQARRGKRVVERRR